MKYLEIYVVDDRYSVPTLRFVDAKDEARARDVAEEILSESAHYLSVEVAQDGRTLFVATSAGRSKPPRGRGTSRVAFGLGNPSHGV